MHVNVRHARKSCLLSINNSIFSKVDGKLSAPRQPRLVLHRAGGGCFTAGQEQKRRCKCQSRPAAAASVDLVFSNKTFVTPKLRKCFQKRNHRWTSKALGSNFGAQCSGGASTVFGICRVLLHRFSVGPFAPVWHLLAITEHCRFPGIILLLICRWSLRWCTLVVWISQTSARLLFCGM